MMPFAAPQQEAPHLGPLVDLLATLPARSVSPAEAPPESSTNPARARSNEARKLAMLSATLRSTRYTPAFGRAFIAARNILALVGLPALCGLLLPQQSDGLTWSLAFVGEPFTAPATESEGSNP